MTESYDLLVNLYDERLWLDRKSIYGTWKPEFIMKYYRQDRQAVIDYLPNKIVQFSEYMAEQILLDYSIDYFDIVGKFYDDHIDEVIGLESYKQIAKQEEIQFLFGEYMGKCTVLRTEQVILKTETGE